MSIIEVNSNNCTTLVGLGQNRKMHVKFHNLNSYHHCTRNFVVPTSYLNTQTTFFFFLTFLTLSFMGGGVMSAVAKFTATGIRSIVPQVHSTVQSASEVSPANKSSGTDDISNPSAPDRVFQAFQLLSESSEAQVLLYKCILWRVFINLYASFMK